MRCALQRRGCQQLRAGDAGLRLSGRSSLNRLTQFAIGDKEENMVGRSRRFWHVAFLAVLIYVGLFDATVLYIDLCERPETDTIRIVTSTPSTIRAEGFGLGGRSLALGPANHDAGQRSRRPSGLRAGSEIAQPHSASVSTVCCSLSR